MTVFATPIPFRTSPSNENAVASLSTNGHLKIVDGSTGSTIFEKMLHKVETEKHDKSGNETYDEYEREKFGENYKNKSDESEIKELNTRENEKLDSSTKKRFGKNKVLAKCEKEKPKKIEKYFSSPVIVDDKIIVGCRDNFLYCFNVS